MMSMLLGCFLVSYVSTPALLLSINCRHSLHGQTCLFVKCTVVHISMGAGAHACGVANGSI